MGLGNMGVGKSKKLSCGGTVMKWIFVLVNLTVLIVGLGILGVSLWIKIDKNTSQYLEVVNYQAKHPYFDYALYMLMAVGGLLFLVSLYGCCGAKRESAGILCSYAFELMLLFLVVITGIVLIMLFRDDLTSSLKTSLATQVKDVCKKEHEGDLRMAWDNIQTALECCGGNNHTEYYQGQDCESEQNNTKLVRIPASCCAKIESAEVPDPDCPSGMRKHAKGCYDGLKVWVSDKGMMLIGVAGALVFVLLLAITLACCVRSDINHGTKS